MRLVRFLSAVAVLVTAGYLTQAPAAQPPKPKKLLLVTDSGGFIHDSVGVAEEVLKEIGPKNGFEVTCFRFTRDPDKKVKYKAEKNAPEMEVTALEAYSAEFRKRTGMAVSKENCGRVNKDTLKNFDAVLFFTTGNPLTPDEVKDLKAWVQAGGAFAGTHCATDTLYNDLVYGELVGAYFRGHPDGLQTIKVKIEDGKHPAAAGFTNGMEYKDEIYVFKDAPYNRDRLHIIFSVQPGSFDPSNPNPKRDNTRKDGDYAISWCREEGKGKVFYTSLGHAREVWKDEKFQSHLLGGLKWATGMAAGDATPSAKK